MLITPDIHQQMRDFEQKTHNRAMQRLESQKVHMQCEFNEMYKKRLEALEESAKWNNAKFLISVGVSVAAVVVSVIAIL